MCDDQAPVKALNFLQSDVSSVVDHESMEEAAYFRSLLTHLLNPVAKQSPLTPPSSGTRRAGDDHQEGPRKRTRSEDTWTSRLDDEEDDHAFHSLPSDGSWMTGLISSMEEDPLEAGLRHDSDATAPSPERFKQRTEVFGALLEFVDEHAKEPEGSLIDQLNRNDET